MANVSQLQPALPPQVQTSSSEASEKDADFLALRLLNRRARLRLSPAPLDLTSFPGKASLFVTANSKGWFAAVTRDASGASALILSPLADLRSALVAASAEDEQSYRPHRRVPIDGATPHILTFACNDTRLLLGLVAGSIHVYASDQLLSSGEGPVQPIHVLTTTSSAPLLSIQPNPGDIPELVAVLRDCTNSPGSLAVELFDVQKHISSGGWMAGKSPGTTPTSISWSPKGKQLALGLQSGDIVTFNPTATATPKYSIPHPPSANNMSAISVHWLSTSSFHTIYAPPGQLAPDAEQIHFHVSLDSKSNSAQDIRFNNPYLPFPGLRPPGEFLVCLRGWDPSKVLLFIGDSTSSDIGLIGSVADDSGEHWYNLALEETSTPSLPLDKDQNDTVLLGMDVDLTNSESYHHSTASGEALQLPAHPVMYVYASDGMVLGWHVLNVTRAPYPGMITGLNASTPALIVPSVPSSIVRELSSDMQTTPAISPTTPAPVEISAIKPPSTIFGQPSTFGAQGSVFGQPSVFGQTQSGFGQQPTSAFGKAPSFGQSATIPAFGSTSTFGQSSTPAFGSAAPSAGFGAFASTGPAKFGQSSFGFGGPPQVTPTPPPSISVPEESMAADNAPSLSGFGLGAANSEDADSKPSIFGKPSVLVSSGQQSTDGTLIRPGTGFGAFAGFDQKSPFAKPSAFSGAQQPTTMFGVSAFQGATANVFGRPAESPEPKTPLAIPSKTTGASTTPSPFTTAPAFSFAARDSIARDDDSRSPSPAPVQPKVTTSSFFSSSTPGPSTGAFSNLQTTPSAFVKPASGIFGELPKDSPFFAPKPPESKPVSAFALAATPGTPASTPPKASSAQPTFGAASMPGATFKSAFPPVAVAPAQTAPASAGSAFSAFSSGGGGFAAFSSGGSKSFSDLLRSTGEDKPPRADGPKTVEVKASEAPVEPKKATETVTIQEPSLESISSSTSSSFVQVSAEEECEMESEEESEVSSSASDEEETEEQVQRESEVSSEAADEEETEEQAQREPEVEAADQEETEQQVQRESGPTGASLPSKPAFTRSPSTTPKAEHPEITVSVSPPPQTPSPSSVPRVSPIRDLSTTPPGSPAKDTPSAPVQMPVPTLRASPPPTSPFALAPRSNNRPIRSSPLASTPIVLEGETEKPLLVSRSAPPAAVAQPAAPKPPFGQWAPPPLPPTVADSTRPKTLPVLLSPSLGEKPALSFFALPTAPAPAPSLLPAGEKPAPSIFAPPTPPASAPSLTPAGEKPAPSIFTLPTTSASAPSFIPAEKVATTNIAPTAAPGPSTPLFTLPTSFASFMPSTGTPSAWGASLKFAEFTPPTTKTAQTPFGGSPSSTPPLPKTLAPAPTPTPEQGMQAECTLLLSTLNKEFENLEQLATKASLKAGDLKKTSGITHQTADLGDPRKWIFGDIEEYGRILVGVQVDVKELKLQRVSLRKAMKELDSNMLKVNTRKEEIVRFNKAKTDAEFAKMLKIRTLAPEYSETQSQLRKNIRAIRDRVQKLEDHIQASKKKINELRTGRPSIRPPSLDTVNRTFRNIDIAIEQQKQEVSQLRRRMGRLENSGVVGARDQLAVSSSRRPLNVTPNVAITTAAALNAERSAQRLKRAMLASRTQPLLNTTATALLVPTSFQTPQKAVVVKPDVKVPDSAFALPTTPTMSFPPSLLGWTPSPLPSEFGSPVLHDPSPSRNRGGTKHHQKPIMLKKNTSPAGPTQQSSSPFAWQPVEPIRPVSSLPFSLRPAGSS